MNYICLLVIDPQNDFCDSKGSLFIQGAEDDMKKLSSFIKKNIHKIDELVVTLDNHNNYHIASPCFWRDANGCNPEPYTQITMEDVKSGKWTPANLNHMDAAFNYIRALEENGKYTHTIWPPHCIIGTWGSCLYGDLSKSLDVFNLEKPGALDYVLKGSNPLTEHYSAVRAEIPSNFDAGTLPNKHLLRRIAEADKVIVSGEALSHCLANTVMDISLYLGCDLSKFILLRDTVSNVPGFEYLGEAFLNKVADMGMVISSTKNIDKLI